MLHKSLSSLMVFVVIVTEMMVSISKAQVPGADVFEPPRRLYAGDKLIGHRRSLGT